MPFIPRKLFFAPAPNPARGSRAILWPRLHAVVFLAFLSVTGSVFGETAYSALRVVGAKRGEEILKQVIEVRGDGTQPPAAWKIVVLDPRARAGVREIEVRNGRVTSESTPKKPRRDSGPMNLAMLNLDSEGVIDVLNQATEAPTSAERIHYSLSNGTASGSPVWTLKMQPPRMGTVDSIEVAADTGQVLTKTGPSSLAKAQPSSDRDRLAETDSRPPALTDDRGEPFDPEKRVTTKPSSSRSRKSVEDVPDAVKSLVRKVKKPVQILRRFLP